MTTTASLDFDATFDRLGHLGVEKQLRAQPGVTSVAANPAGPSVTVTFDEGRTSIETLRKVVEDCGFHCEGEA
ncbi:MAG: hypothetical protein B7Z31_04045, partial [Rhodobacterales bacterium 12-65-15]